MTSLLFRFGFLGALETDDQGNCQGEFFGCLDDAFGDIVAAHDTTKDVNKYTLHFRIREKYLERLLDRFGRGTSENECMNATRNGKRNLNLVPE